MPLETNQANLGTVSEMSKSVNEFDFSSIEEFPADEEQQAINCREMKPLFSKIEKCKLLEPIHQILSRFKSEA